MGNKNGLDATAHVESEIRKAKRKPHLDTAELEGLFLLRDALAKAPQSKKRKRVQTSRVQS